MLLKIKLRLCFTFAMLGLAIYGSMAMAAAPEATVVPVVSGPAVTSGVMDSLTAANDWYARRESEGAAEKAIELYLKVISQNPRHYEALWRLARSYWWQGDHASKNQAEIFDSGMSMAERAIQASPQSVEGYFWRGVCLGRASEIHGIFNSLASVGTIRESMEAALKIDPKYHGAMHVLGVLYRKAPGWPLSVGDMDKSLHYARLAVQSAPTVVLDHIGLAETLLAKGQKREAIKILEEALTLPGQSDQQPEMKEDKQKAGRLLEQLR